MPSAGLTLAVFADLLSRMQKEPKTKEKQAKLARFIDAFRFRKTDSNPSPPSFFPVLRLLLPKCDKDRDAYGIKDLVLAKLYVDALSIQDSPDAHRLIHWRTPVANGRAAGDFGEVLFDVLKDRIISSASNASASVDLVQVNQKLDELCNATEK